MPTPLRFAAPERPPVTLKIEPLPEVQTEEADEIAEATRAAAAVSNASIFGDFSDFNFAVPNTSDLDRAFDTIDPAKVDSVSDITENTESDANAVPQGPPPIILSDDYLNEPRAEDIMPFFRLPSVPSKATYRKQ
ncbi:hypothetical protein [Actomonas aquatica]|uniref:Uncharacterized protein n=1 Tax=Actomonas aquatica TaxID=2866162 RepID=A0ABZ1CCF0_9BACT|nr:hypothetical protein [Opitutus sp. WL0086]WRQ89337.1 hypothetical protein K1X11_007945 [Opitutus sp. WL0086]